MKIKAVCEQTGLTDRAIRFYIEEELLSPNYTENYIGRRAYDFSEEDVHILREITVLRAYGYSVAEIAQMQHEPEMIAGITQALIARTEKELEDKKAALHALRQLKTAEIHDVTELAADLSAQSVNIYEIPEDKLRGWYRDFREDAPRILAILCACIPALVALIVIPIDFSHYRFPQVSLHAVGMLLLLLLPSLFLLLLVKRKKWRVVRILLAILCLLCTPVIFYGTLFGGVVDVSATDRVSRYRVFDRGCDAADDPAFQALFPKDVPLKDMPGSRYHYSYAPTIFGEADNIYAEWRIEDGEAFEREVRRAEELFGEEDFVKGRKTLRVQRGSYRCLLLYDDTDRYEGAEPFTEPDSIYYWYCLFAWDEGTNTVRYYFGRSWKGDDPPYYLSLDWN